MRSRLWIVLAGFALWGAALGGRLWQLQVVDHERYDHRARDQQLEEIQLESPRGTIYDARGRELAVSVTVDSAFTVPGEIDDPGGFAARLAGVPGVDARRIARAAERRSKFAWVSRKLDPPVARELRERALGEVHFLEESKRYYPMRKLAGPVLGFVGVDNYGLGGLEARWEKTLSGDRIDRTLLKDARRGTLQAPGLSFRDAEPGGDIHLTIDAAIQHLAERELARAVERHRARGGTVVVLDPRSGAVVAMASEPGFDPNRFEDFPRERWRNRAVTDAYEPGSTFKVITAAAALESNRVDPSDPIDCEMGAIEIAGKTIRDHKPFGVLTFREVIARSSNVGAIKLGRRVGGPALERTIRAFGFGRPTGVDLPGESAGLLGPLEGRAWAYASFGQGLAVTPLQLASAFAAVANGGELYRPYVVSRVVRDGLVEEFHPRPTSLGRPIGAATARSLERLLEAVVEEGTGKRAAIDGYRVAGKTGTAEKIVNGTYSTELHVASFVGFAPARDPALVALVAIDEPRGLYHGGDVAAPVFAAIVGPALLYLGVPAERAPEETPAPVAAVAAAAAAPAAAPPPAASASDAGRLPDFSGWSARRALARSAQLGLEVRLRGHGFVRHQSPAAGAPLAAAGGRLELWLATGPTR